MEVREAGARAADARGRMALLWTPCIALDATGTRDRASGLRVVRRALRGGLWGRRAFGAIVRHARSVSP